MSEKRVRFPGIDGEAIMLVGGTYKPGDQAPSGYVDWQEWAEVQHKAGLRQKECGKCGKWKYPQELSDRVGEYTAHTKKLGPTHVQYPICKECAHD